jgi:hypothetical protein
LRIPGEDSITNLVEKISDAMENDSWLYYKFYAYI